VAIRWQLFPRFLIPPKHVQELVRAFETVVDSIGTPKNQLSSNAVLKALQPHLETIGFEVESGKGQAQLVARPVLFGLGGRAEKSFLVDAFQPATGTVLEVEAGRAVINYQFLKDLFEACTIQDACYLAIAVMNEYKPKSAKIALQDFATVTNFVDTLYASGRLSLPLEGVVVIGY
jgi:hypothetical protein